MQSGQDSSRLFLPQSPRCAMHILNRELRVKPRRGMLELSHPWGDFADELSYERKIRSDCTAWREAALAQHQRVRCYRLPGIALRRQTAHDYEIEFFEPHVGEFNTRNFGRRL
jgi:hypothetical protein